MPSPLHARVGGAGYEAIHGMAGSRSVEYDCHTVDLQLVVWGISLPSILNFSLLKLSLPNDNIMMKPETPTNRLGADLVGYVQNQVCQEPRHYHAFLGALRSNLAQYDDILTN